MGSRAPEHSRCSARNWLPCSMWDLPGSGIEPVSPALAGGFFTTESPGKPWVRLFLVWGLGEQPLPIGQMYILVLLEMGKPEDHGNGEIQAFDMEAGLGMSQEPGVSCLKRTRGDFCLPLHQAFSCCHWLSVEWTLSSQQSGIIPDWLLCPTQLVFKWAL